jgi:hypothetical protein
MADKVAVREREARALALRRDGHTYAEIGEVLCVNRQMATRVVKRGLDRIVREPAEQVRVLELERLDQAQVEALAVLRSHHVLVQGGRVIKDDDGQPLADPGPVLAAIGTLLKIMERRAKLLGLDRPARHDVSADLSVVSIDALDAEIDRLMQQLHGSDQPEPPAELDPPETAHHAVDQEAEADRPAGAEPAETPGFYDRLGEAVEVGFAALGLDPAGQEVVAAAIEEYLRRNAGLASGDGIGHDHVR